MKRSLFLLGAAVVTTGLLLAASANAAPPSPFVGTWWATDPGDGSLEQLTFGAGGSMFFRDDLASGPACGGTAAFAKDTGSVLGNVWTGSGNATLQCVGTDRQLRGLFFQFTLNPDGTLSEPFSGEVWTRSRP
jgi:hypothetical protein